MFRWVGKILGGRSAVLERSENPVLNTAVQKSAEIYRALPLNQFIDSQCSDQLARHFYLEINSVCNATDPIALCRQKLAMTMLRFALYQVLMIPPEPENDTSGLRSCPGISGELTSKLETLAKKSIAFGSDLHESQFFSEDADLWTIVQTEYWKTYWMLKTLNVVRKELGDFLEENDWYRPFMHSACANQENLYRIDLDMPSVFDRAIAREAPAAYSIFTDIVVSGARDPMAEWRDYHAGSPVPAPGEECGPVTISGTLRPSDG